MNKIPLFPLKLVVYPKSRYPLHIFESRYKKMIRQCLIDNSGFGIVAQVGTEISNIGCYVTVENLIKKYESGEMDIIVRGIERFAIIKIDVHEDGYYLAETLEYSDNDSSADPDLLTETTTSFKDLLSKVNIELEDSFWNSFKNSEIKSYKIAEKSGLSISEQQELLIIQNENIRLQFLRDHFNKVQDQIDDSQADNGIIMNDGFIN